MSKKLLKTARLYKAARAYLVKLREDADSLQSELQKTSAEIRKVEGELLNLSSQLLTDAREI